ncbi:MAG TPA: hypothetical protein VJP80_04175 [Candidatus Saccharimonadales bacterium]|nr:hypothetical protein [Candidatus Saccharimonadales bacterium]
MEYNRQSEGTPLSPISAELRVVLDETFRSDHHDLEQGTSSGMRYREVHGAAMGSVDEATDQVTAHLNDFYDLLGPPPTDDLPERSE